LNEIVKDTQALRVLGFRNIDEGPNFGRLEKVSDQFEILQWSGTLGPRKRYARCPFLSPTPVVHPCSSGAIWHRLPCFGVSKGVGSGIIESNILHNFAGLDDALDFINQE
jgi:hypothetical protein